MLWSVLLVSAGFLLHAEAADPYDLEPEEPTPYGLHQDILGSVFHVLTWTLGLFHQWITLLRVRHAFYLLQKRYPGYNLLELLEPEVSTIY